MNDEETRAKIKETLAAKKASSRRSVSKPRLAALIKAELRAAGLTTDNTIGELIEWLRESYFEELGQ